MSADPMIVPADRPSQRIDRGCHRLGIVLAGLILFVGLFDLAMKARWIGDFAAEAIGSVPTVVAFAAVAYGVVRGLGWTIAGFMRG